MKHHKPIYLVLSKPYEKLAEGSSRFWGNPDLPEDTGYPTYTDDEGDDYPYFFICQINLADLAAFAPENPLPQKGLLSFFAKIDHYLGYMAATDGIQSHISEPDAVKVLYFPDTENLREVVLVDDNDQQTAPEEMAIGFANQIEPLADEHALFAAPTHREWETWDHPFEKWEILLQVDSFEGMDFSLNFMDCGVLDFLISPEDLAAARFDRTRAIVLST
jgi:Uncharacterized protein conserved in bacteria